MLKYRDTGANFFKEGFKHSPYHLMLKYRDTGANFFKEGFKHSP